MKSLGRKPEGARLERIKASPRWAGEQFRNVHPIIPGLRDPKASMPTHPRLHLRRRAANAAGAVAVDEPARGVEQACRERPARHVARPFHRADRDRRPARADRSGVGSARIAVAPRGPQALPAGARSPARDAAARPGHRLARSLRSSRLSDHPRARQARRAVRDVARRRRASRSLGRAARAHRRARLVGIVQSAEYGRSR